MRSRFPNEGTMSLSPDVAPFVPKQSVVPTQQKNVSQSSLWKLSADVAEFIPQCQNNESRLLPNERTSSVTVKNISNIIPSNKTSKSKTQKTTNSSNDKKNVPKEKPKHPNIKNKEPSVKNDDDESSKIETDFPALVRSFEEQHKPAPTIWSGPFGATFSEKLKSSNTTSYFGNESQRFSSDRPEKEQKSKVKQTNKGSKHKNTNKFSNETQDKKSLDTKTNISKNHEEQSSSYEDNNFSVVRHKARKLHETVELNNGVKSQEKSHLAWTENPSDEQTTGVKKFSNNRSKKMREQQGNPNIDTLDIEIQKHPYSSSNNWRSNRNIPEQKREIQKTSISEDKGILKASKSVKSTKDYYTLKSTYGDSGNRNKSEQKKKEEDVIKGTSAMANVESRVPLSYSEILKSKPIIQLPEPERIDESQRGILQLPSDGSDDGEMNEQEVQEQKGKTKKKKKKKKKSSVEAPPQPIKKSKERMTLDIGDMFTKILETSTTKKKTVVRTGGFLPGQASLPSKETRTMKKSDLTHTQQAANVLDSTAPIVFHSKEREFPKKKKPSAMRKILMKEREEKKLIREGKSPAEHSEDEENSEKQSSDEKQMDSDEIDAVEVKKSIHSRKFREYCDQDLDYEINGLVITLLKELIRFQDRQYHKDPIKAKARRRFVCGLREVHKHAKLKKLKCVIVTPNLEPTKSKGGLDDLLSNIIDACHSQNVPVIFSLNRQILGKVLLKKVPVSVVGIFYYDGAQDYFKSLMQLTEVARETYRDKFKQAREKFLVEKQASKGVENIETIPEAMPASTEIQKDKAQSTEDVTIGEATFDTNEQSVTETVSQVTKLHFDYINFEDKNDQAVNNEKN